MGKLIDVTIDLTGFRDAVGALPVYLEERWAQATEDTTRLAKELAPYKVGYRGPHPGPHLRNTIFGRVVGSYHSVVWATSGHARYIEFGRGPVFPHHLTPSGKPGFLRWWSASGVPIFRRSAGPAAAQPYMRPAASQFASFLVSDTGLAAPAFRIA